MQGAGTRDPSDDDVIVLTGAAPSPTHRLLALGVVPGLLVLLFVITRPFASLQLPRVPAFVPIETSALFVIDLVTAVIFFSQFSILRSRALLVIANGYLFAALILIPYLLAFPGLFAPDRALVGGLQTTAWLYILKHCGLAGSMVAFAVLSRSVTTAPKHSSHRPAVLFSLATTTALVVAIGVLCIAGDEHLPTVAADGRRFSANWIFYAGAPIATLYGSAVTLLWPQRNTVLGLWLLVVASVHLAGVPMAFFGPSSRFSVGWYTVVIINLVANSLVLVVLLVEVSNLYRRLLKAVRAQRAERQARLFTGDAVAAMIAHEVKQPLAAMIMRARTSARTLARPEPDLATAKVNMQRIAADGLRAAEIIDSIRANFKQDQRARTVVDINRLIAETTSLMHTDLRKRRIRIRVGLASQTLTVAGNRTQLQQVLYNLIMNAAEATAATHEVSPLDVQSLSGENGEVLVSVADLGSGVGAQHLERIFDPLYTTKPDGMGMGLSICRSIIEAHGGRIWASPNSPNGAVFQFTLPAAPES
ncbi:MASE4 domain-containing protein [Caulobacter sp. BE254]|uniref:MASE4 domain-containing protein n=1 Tax=Caulobacter sp. BE254 TaxID=2817720 RepID=UPI0028554BDB|nr:MASE4 domain-containing protein [Caulobacter sp. BE254]MDR7114427.1 signal transduction histidine kinase [Caulobacter sp. BE254]